jgi:hypothetical protein
MRPPYTVRPFNPKKRAWSTHLGTINDAAKHHWLALMSKEVEEPVILDADDVDITERVFLLLIEEEGEF